MRRPEIKSKTFVVAGIIALILCFAQTSIFTEAADRKMEAIRKFSKGSLCKVNYKGNLFRDMIVYDDGTMEEYLPDKHGSLFSQDKLSTPLQKAMDSASDEVLIPVGIWITDIDHDKVKRGMKSSKEKVNEYIDEERQLSKKEYKDKNTAFINQYLKNGKVVFMSSYAPFIIANVTKQVVKRMYKDTQTLGLELFTNEKKVDEVMYSIPNIRANYTRDTLNLKGTGVKVGIVESGYPNKNNTQLSDRNIIFDIPDSEASLRLSSHATIVTSIVVGKSQGIAPGTTVYAVGALSQAEDYQKIEWLLDQGVILINYSAGYTSVRGEYSDMAKWIDHLGNQHNVFFIKSSGNAYGSTFTITDPGMAYNPVTVGSIWEHNSTGEPYWQDDTLSTSSCYVESSGGYKPDLTAPGEEIDIAGYTNNSGTSFAAPHVTGVLAQLLGYRNSLAFNNAALKAITAAGTLHRTATDYGQYALSPYFSDKEGVGVIDAQAAYGVASNTSYESMNLTTAQFPYERTFTVPTAGKTVRVSLAWFKQNTISAASHAGAAVTERPLSDLDLQVYGPNGNLVASSNSANNNLELVQFVAGTTGTYRIEVVGYALQNNEERIGLAWFQ